MNGMGGNMAPLMSMPPVMTIASRLDDADQAYERPPPKRNTELYDPRIPPRRSMAAGQSPDRINGLAEQVNVISVEDGSKSHT